MLFCTNEMALALLILAIFRCQTSAPVDTLTPEFKKSCKFAYALLQTGRPGHAGIEHRYVPRFGGSTQANASTSDETMAASMLGSYRAYEYMKITPEQMASTLAEMKQTRCELDKMFNEGFRGVEAMKASGEKLG